VFGTQRYGQVNGWVALLVALGLAAAPWLIAGQSACKGVYERPSPDSWPFPNFIHSTFIALASALGSVRLR
jgi:hypothetical protein